MLTPSHFCNWYQMKWGKKQQEMAYQNKTAFFRVSITVSVFTHKCSMDFWAYIIRSHYYIHVQALPHSHNSVSGVHRQSWGQRWKTKMDTNKTPEEGMNSINVQSGHFLISGLIWDISFLNQVNGTGNIWKGLCTHEKMLFFYEHHKVWWLMQLKPIKSSHAVMWTTITSRDRGGRSRSPPSATPRAWWETPGRRLITELIGSLVLSTNTTFGRKSSFSA